VIARRWRRTAAPGRLVVAVFLCAATLCSVGSVYAAPRVKGTGPLWCAHYGGRDLASYDDVYACLPVNSGADANDPFDSDPGFQCTELANRFLFQATGRKVFAAGLVGGNFVSLAAGSLEIQPVVSGAPWTLPSLGDIISMWGGSRHLAQDSADTHVALVVGIAATSSGWNITTLNQHDQSDTIKRQGKNTITVSHGGRSWSFNSGYFTDFEWFNPVQKPRWSWKPAESPVPAHAIDGSGAAVLGLSCAADTSCAAGGFYDYVAGRLAAMLLTMSGTMHWKASPAPLPAGAAEPNNSEVAAVACATASACIAVGYYNSTDDGLIETMSGRRWTPATARLPSNAASSVLGSVTLDTISCPSPAYCVAGGQYLDRAGHRDGLLLTKSGASWQASEAPLPAGAAASGQVAQVNGISCTAVSDCVAVGSYTAKGGEVQALALRLTGGKWAAAQVPVPGGGATTSSALDAVSCPSAGECVGGGEYGSSGQAEPLLVQLPGESWPPLQAPGNGNDVVQAMSCSSLTFCLAGTRSADLLGWRASSWMSTPAPMPRDAGVGSGSSAVTAISCPALTLCYAAGFYNLASSGHGLLLVGTG
jgi:hypothetical protein